MGVGCCVQASGKLMPSFDLSSLSLLSYLTFSFYLAISRPCSLIDLLGIYVSFFMLVVVLFPSSYFFLKLWQCITPLHPALWVSPLLAFLSGGLFPHSSWFPFWWIWCCTCCLSHFSYGWDKMLDICNWEEERFLLAQLSVCSQLAPVRTACHRGLAGESWWRAWWRGSRGSLKRSWRGT